MKKYLFNFALVLGVFAAALVALPRLAGAQDDISQTAAAPRFRMQ